MTAGSRLLAIGSNTGGGKGDCGAEKGKAWMDGVNKTGE